MSTPHLDTRVVRILRWLLEQPGPVSTEALAKDLGLSQRVVRYRLDAVDRYLRSQRMQLIKRRGSGVWVDGEDSAKLALGQALSVVVHVPQVYARTERQMVLLTELLWSAPGPISLDYLHESLEVSKASARRDLKWAETWLERMTLVLRRRPGVGIEVVGTENNIRQGLVQVTIESVPEPVLAAMAAGDGSGADLVRVAAGIREHLLELNIDRTTRLIRESLAARPLGDSNADVVFAVFLAVAVRRLQNGHTVSLDKGSRRSLRDHPVSQSALLIAEALADAFGVELDDDEVGSVTEYMLGLASLEPDQLVHEAHEDLLDELMARAAAGLHPALAGDVELRRNISQHLDRLSVRLAYGLPVHNPLLLEVATRYPDVHRLALELGDAIAEHFHAMVGEAEVGFVTMYLAGALERKRLRPARRVAVVCPSGMATAWVLVSRIQAELPHLQVVRVLSSRTIVELDPTEIDLVVATVGLPESGMPTVVVNPLLTPTDIRTINDLWAT